MKLWEVFRFEIDVQLRRRSVWLHVVALLALIFYMVGEMAAGEQGGVYVNAPAEIFEYMVLGSLFALLVTAALAGEAATRDVRARMEALLFTAPVGKGSLLGGRFLGVFVLNALLLLAVAVVIELALRTSGTAPEMMGPFRVASYVHAYLVFVLPNVFIGAVLLFVAALLSRRAVVSYIVGGFLFVGTLFHLGVTAKTFGLYGLGAHLDAFGFVAASVVIMSWTPIQENVLLVPFDGWIVTNRLLWLALAVAAGLLGSRRFRFTHHASGRTRRGPSWLGRRVLRGPASARPPAMLPAVPQVGPDQVRAFGSAGRARQLVAVSGRTFRQLAAGRGWLPLVAIALLQVLTGPELMEHIGVPLMPTTARVFEIFAANSVPIVVSILVALYAGELVWADRDAGMDALVDAAPVPDGVLLGGKLLGLGLVVLVMQTLLAVAGLTVQLLLGYTDVEPGLYLRVLFGLQLTDYGLFAVLAVAVHVLADHKYAGHLVVLLAYVFTATASILGVEHHLLVYGGAPAWTYTELSGFGGSLRPFLLFKLYWTGWALLLAVFALLYRVRGAEHGLRQRHRQARRGFTAPVGGLAAAAAALVLLAGGFVFYNTNVLNEYRPAEERAARRAAYERRYGRFDGLPQPHVAAAEMHVELYPERGAADVRGTYWLVNDTGGEIDTLHLAPASAVTTMPVTFDRAAEAVHRDDDLGHRIYRLTRPLLPGDTLRMQFVVHHAPRGFTNSGAASMVVENGTFVTTEAWLPQVGYQGGRALHNARERAAHGLPPRPAVRPLGDLAARRDPTGRVRVDLDVTIGTAAGQTAVAPGALQQAWTEGDRRYVRYVSEAPMRANIPVFSARYAVQEAQWRAPDASGQVVDIQVYYLPGRPWNVDRMIRSVQVSLDTFTELLGPYPYGTLKVVAAPDASTGATAYPGLITVRDGLAAMRPDEDHRDVDFVSAVIAHEVAHQWWGHQLVPALVEGAPVLTESLAWYSALGVVEAAYGPEHLRRFLAVLREAYLPPRPTSGVPLLRAVDGFDGFRKGPFAMYALRTYVGETRVNTALRRLLDAHGADEPPYPTSLDLYQELQAVTPDALQYLLEDLFARNTFWDLKAERATAEQTGTGAWRVTLDVAAHKIAVDSVGVETEHPMDDLVEVGIFAADGLPLHLQMHRVRSGTQTIDVTVPRAPARAEIDPRSLLIDLTTNDNTANIDG